ncbi:hypothetical protein BAY61_05440 [Prauserella marina]|uniref:Uncharacterized protein n=1 Tax=Prauserella marina TaxID=530584 RepID=A0A222VKS6_9PSEU|nr:hypothetical protein [Prauserella marina]ASR34525.1 hypothetical protein BAY61_05440 [Prauserella marina]PWV85870.1 hypothetical protein DES30_1011900 [Prauserella marina]SDC43475.1 hypothetical protein SAMN05421630_10292 [Prauserella marina]
MAHPHQGLNPPSGPGYPGQWSAPASPPAGPLTRANWGSVAAVALGTVTALVGLLFLDWVQGSPLSDVAAAHQAALDQGLLPQVWGREVLQFYLDFGALLLVVLHAAYMLAWVSGGVRGRSSARLILSMSGKGIAAGRLTGARIMMGGASAILAVFHVLILSKLFDGQLGVLEAGGWVMLTGLVIVTVGAVAGPLLPARDGR